MNCLVFLRITLSTQRHWRGCNTR